MRADVEVQVFCHACGHHDVESTACEYLYHQKLVKRGEITEREFKDKHAFMKED